MNVVIISHLFCAAAFAVLALLLIAGKQRNRTTKALGAGCLATVIWAGAVADSGTLPASIVAVVESVRDAVWLLFMRSLIVPADRPIQSWARTGAIVVYAVAALAVGIDLASLVFDPTATQLSQPQILVRISIAVLGLSLVENYYRNTAADSRWNVVPLAIAMGAMFAFDLFFYADAQLSRKIDLSLTAARALANLFSVPLIYLGMMRNKNWRKSDLRLSHNAAFHAVTLISSGIFLMAVALVGVLFRHYGGQWGMILQVTSLFGSAVVLATVLSSETARSGIRMAILRNFFSYRYDYRVEWLHCIEALSADDAAVNLPERVVRAVADIVNSPGGVLFQRHDHAFVPSALWNARVPSEAQEPLDSAFVAAFRGGRWIHELPRPDAPSDAVVWPAWLAEAPDFWLAVPLAHQDEIAGFVLLIKPRAPINPDWEVFDLLRTVARQAASYLSEQRAERALADAHMLQEYSKRFAFVVHDIKNLSSQLGLILSNARRHGSNPEFQADVMHTVENSVERMNKLLSQLKVANVTPAAANDGPGTSDALAVVREVVGAHSQGNRIDLVCASAGAAVIMDLDPLRSVLAHLLDNALEASGSQGRVAVSLGGESDRVTIDITDLGPGMDMSFVRDELFRPFRSTKDGGFGIGAFQTRELIRAADGQLEVITKPGAGTTMRIVLHAAPALSQVSAA